MRVLVVKDERDLAEAVVRGLSRQGLAVNLARDGAEALDRTWVSTYDMIVLDRDLQPSFVPADHQLRIADPDTYAHRLRNGGGPGPGPRHRR